MASDCINTSTTRHRSALQIVGHNCYLQGYAIVLLLYIGAVPFQSLDLSHLPRDQGVGRRRGQGVAGARGVVEQCEIGDKGWDGGVASRRGGRAQ